MMPHGGAGGTKVPFRCNSLRRSTPAGPKGPLGPAGAQSWTKGRQTHKNFSFTRILARIFVKNLPGLRHLSKGRPMADNIDPLAALEMGVPQPPHP